MRLMVGLYRYFPFGGLQRDMLSIVTECTRRGHQVDIFCRSWEGDKPAHPNMAIHELPAMAGSLMPPSNHGKNAGFVTSFMREVKLRQPDMVIGFDKMPGLDIYYAADSCFKAKLYSERPWVYRLLPRYRHFLQTEASLFGASATTHILAISQRSTEEYQQYYATPSQRLTLLPPGIRRDCVNDTGKRLFVLHEELGLGQQDLLVLMVGSGFQTKGLDRAIRAVAALPAATARRTHLVVAGQDDGARYSQLARSLGIGDRLHLLGGRNDIAALLRSADVLVHPARRENTGTVLLEAAVSCLPVLATDVCGYAHYLEEHQLGVVLRSPFQQQALNNALQEMLEDDQQRLRWRDQGKVFASTADIFDLASHAVDAIEQQARVRKLTI